MARVAKTDKGTTERQEHNRKLEQEKLPASRIPYGFIMQMNPTWVALAT